jgi:hypothetical protein
MSGAILTIAEDGPPPVIELIFGDAQWGRYSVYLWDAAGHQPTLVRKGLNNDTIADRFPLSISAAELDGSQVTWEVTIGALGGGQGQLYNLQVIFTQGTTLLDRLDYQGALDSVKVIADFAKIAVA